MKPRGPHVCPNCGERVTMFAAGCSICGAELDPRRAESPLLSRLLRRIRPAPGRSPTIARRGRLRLR
jgi:predicted amidophosphoribosyltransferase